MLSAYYGVLLTRYGSLRALQQKPHAPMGPRHPLRRRSGVAMLPLGSRDTAAQVQRRMLRDLKSVHFPVLLVRPPPFNRV